LTYVLIKFIGTIQRYIIEIVEEMNIEETVLKYGFDFLKLYEFNFHI